MKKNIFLFGILFSLVVLGCGGEDGDPDFTVTDDDVQATSSGDTQAVAQVYSESVESATFLLKRALEGNDEYLKNATSANCSAGGSISFSVTPNTVAGLTTLATSGGTLEIVATASACKYTYTYAVEGAGTETYVYQVDGTVTSTITVTAGLTAADLGTGENLKKLVAVVTGTDVKLTYDYTLADGSNITIVDTADFTFNVNSATSDYYMDGTITVSSTLTETLDGVTYSGTCEATGTVGTDGGFTSPETFANGATIEGTVSGSCTDSTGVKVSAAYGYTVFVSSTGVITTTVKPL